MAKSGLNFMDSQFRYNPITNERVGKGTIHVRAKNDQELGKMTDMLASNGMNVEVRSKYKPVWNNY